MSSARPRNIRSVRRSASTATRWTRRVSSAFAYGISRHGYIAAARLASHPPTRRTAKRTGAMVLGSAFIGFGVAMFVRAGFGLPPYDVLLSVIRDTAGVSLGQAGWALATVFLLAAVVLGQPPKAATLVYIVLNGVTIDAALKVLREPDAVGVRIAFVAFGIGAIASGIALVVHSGNPGGAFELIMRAGAARGWDPMRVRTGLEVGLLGLGIAAGGDFGLATVAFALLISPLMRAGSQALEDHRTGRRLRVSQATRPDSGRHHETAHDLVGAAGS